MKLFTINFTLAVHDSVSRYEEKGSIRIAGSNDADARGKFLNSINSTSLFISPSGTYWAMEFTRAMINSTSEYNAGVISKESDPKPEVESVAEVKPPRKPRGPNKPKKQAKKKATTKTKSTLTKRNTK